MNAVTSSALKLRGRDLYRAGVEHPIVRIRGSRGRGYSFTFCDGERADGFGYFHDAVRAARHSFAKSVQA